MDLCIFFEAGLLLQSFSALIFFSAIMQPHKTKTARTSSPCNMEVRSWKHWKTQEFSFIYCIDRYQENIRISSQLWCRPESTIPGQAVQKIQQFGIVSYARTSMHTGFKSWGKFNPAMTLRSVRGSPQTYWSNFKSTQALYWRVTISDAGSSENP